MRIDKHERNLRRKKKKLNKDCVNYEAVGKCRVEDRVFNCITFCDVNCKRYVKRSKK